MYDIFFHILIQLKEIIGNYFILPFYDAVEMKNLVYTTGETSRIL